MLTEALGETATATVAPLDPDIIVWAMVRIFARGEIPAGQLRQACCAVGLTDPAAAAEITVLAEVLRVELHIERDARRAEWAFGAQVASPLWREAKAATPDAVLADLTTGRVRFGRWFGRSLAYAKLVRIPLRLVGRRAVLARAAEQRRSAYQTTTRSTPALASPARPRARARAPRRAAHVRRRANGTRGPDDDAGPEPPPGQPSRPEAKEQHGDGRRETRQERAEVFLRRRLAGGRWCRASSVQSDATALGIAPRTLRRARVAVGVQIRREGFGPGGRSLWRLRPPVLATTAAGLRVETAPLPGEAPLDHAARHRERVLFFKARERWRGRLVARGTT